MEAASLRDARLAWQAANYIRFAYHQPNDMPERPGNERREGVNRPADLAYARAWMKAMHNNSRGKNGR